MAKVIVLGGCGAVGSVAVKTLAAQDMFAQVVIGDMNITKAEALAKDLGPKPSKTLEPGFFAALRMTGSAL